jgi:hypothetical protein
VNAVVSGINIQNSSTHDHDYCTENFMSKIKNFMTDRSATENIVNLNSFTSSFHPLLQLGAVAQKKVGEIEKNCKINQDLNLGDSASRSIVVCYVIHFLC